jgi:hypothetical protein
MRCPLCKRLLVKMYRVVYVSRRTLGRDGKVVYAPKYVPIWVCETHEFSVEINRLRGGSELAAILKEGKWLVRTKPGRKPSKRTLGSASDY